MSCPSWRPVLNGVYVDIRFERMYPNLKYFNKIYIGVIYFDNAEGYISNAAAIK